MDLENVSVMEPSEHIESSETIESSENIDPIPYFIDGVRIINIVVIVIILYK